MTEQIPVRVTVLDTWSKTDILAAVDQSIAALKAQALAAVSINHRPEEFLIKYRGAEVDETLSVGQAGVVPHAPLIVLRRRRSPSR